VFLRAEVNIEQWWVFLRLVVKVNIEQWWVFLHLVVKVNIEQWWVFLCLVVKVNIEQWWVFLRLVVEHVVNEVIGNDSVRVLKVCLSATATSLVGIDNAAQLAVSLVVEHEHRLDVM